MAPKPKTRTPAGRRKAWAVHVGNLGRDLVEMVAGEETPLKVDREKGVIYGVKVLGRYSKNTHDTDGVTGTEYSPNAMRQACELYEGVTVRLDHPDRKNPAAARSVHDSIGKLRNCRLEGECVRADLVYNRKHPFAEELLEDVERGIGNYGLSHNARAGRETVRDGRLVIEELELVRSVDLVDKPATNRNLWESETMPAKTFRELLEIRCEKLSKMRRPWADALLEDDGAYMDAPVEGAPTDPDDAIKAGFRAAITAVLDDDTMDVKAQLKKIGELLKTEEKLLGSDEPKDAPAADTTESEDKKGDEGDAADEKDKKESYRERLDTLERKDKARDLCESIQFIPTKDQLADLVAIADDAARKRVAEAYKAAAGKAAPARGPRSRAPGRNVAESQQKPAPSGRPVPASTKGWLNRAR